MVALSEPLSFQPLGSPIPNAPGRSGPPHGGQPRQAARACCRERTEVAGAFFRMPRRHANRGRRRRKSFTCELASLKPQRRWKYPQRLSAITPNIRRTAATLGPNPNLLQYTPKRRLWEVAVAALGDAPQDGSVSGRHLFRHETDPCGKIAPSCECRATADRCNHRTRDDRANAFIACCDAPPGSWRSFLFWASNPAQVRDNRPKRKLSVRFSFRGSPQSFVRCRSPACRH